MRVIGSLTIISALGCAASAFAQTPAPAAPAPPPDVKIETTAISPGVYLFVGRGGNIGVTAGPDGVAIIDDQFADMAGKIRAAAALLSEKPIRYVINTHVHGDHTGSNEAMGKAGAVIIAHDNVRKRLSEPHVDPTSGNTTPPQPAPALPVVTFADGASLHINGEQLKFMYLPNAHTDTDIVIRFMNANVVHMGDTFTGGFPFIDGSRGGTLDGLIAGHDKVIAWIDDSTKVIRGHGPIGAKADLVEYRNMLATVRDRVAKLVRSGKSQDDVVASKPTAEFEAKYGNPNFNAAQWVGRVYVDQKRAAELKKKKR